jgi:RHS repeat-associated protein
LQITSQTGANLEDIQVYPWGQTQQYTGPMWPGIYGGLASNLCQVEPCPDQSATRDYPANLGRWMVPDPAGLAAADLGNPQSLNQYAYVRNNPTSFVDPSGLDPCSGAPDPRVCHIEDYYGLAGSPGLYMETSDEFNAGGSPDPCADPVYAEINAMCGQEPPLGPPVTITPPYLMGGPGGGLASGAGLPGAAMWSENPGINIYPQLSPDQWLSLLLLPSSQLGCEFGPCDALPGTVGNAAMDSSTQSILSDEAKMAAWSLLSPLAPQLWVALSPHPNWKTNGTCAALDAFGNAMTYVGVVAALLKVGGADNPYYSLAAFGAYSKALYGMNCAK